MEREAVYDVMILHTAITSVEGDGDSELY